MISNSYGWIASRMPSPIQAVLGGPSKKELAGAFANYLFAEQVEKVLRNVTLVAVGAVTVSQVAGLCFGGGLKAVLLAMVLPAVLFEEIIRVIGHLWNLQPLPPSITLRSLDQVSAAISRQPLLTLDIAIASAALGLITSTACAVVQKFKQRILNDITQRHWGYVPKTFDIWIKAHS